MKHLHILFGLICIGMVACNSNKSSSEMELNDMLASTDAELMADINDDSFNEIIRSIPSPLELASEIRSTGVDFNEELMNPDENKDYYTTSYDKAFNLGVYGGDLGYINMYEKSYLAMNYLGAIKKLAEDLKVGHFFDFNTIKRFATNKDKLDSLLYISTSSFTRMDDYLMNQKRGHISALIVAGSWLEGMYIASEIACANPAHELIERIGEQKIVLDQVMAVLTVFESDPYFGNLVNEFSRIKSIYDDVSIDYHYEEPETKEVDGRLVIINNSNTEVNISLEQVDSIKNVVAEIRTGIISG